MDRDGFYLKIAHALSGCQLVEQQLKLYISEALELAKECVGQRMVFRMSGEDYENSSLDRLIEVFSKLTVNSELVAALRRFKEERNFLSHKGIALCLDYEGDLLLTAAEGYETRLAKVQFEAERLRAALHSEGRNISVELDFGFLPNGHESGDRVA